MTSRSVFEAKQARGLGQPPRRPVLSVVVPVYNQAASIVENVEEIRRRVARGLAEAVELIVVSDGSIDRTAERLLAARDEDLRVIHYDRNLGKGYALKAGALAARGEWISYVDADLDLDPGALPRFLEVAREEDLDFAIGSKRHPESEVHYPASRRAASWLYQQLVRLLFRLDVRDTQVGLKVFRHAVADEVLPLVIVKQFAFDLELLAVARSLGFRRIRELPIRLDYKFTGSGVRSIAVMRALIDTAAIFYRLRVLRYYARKRQLLGESVPARASWERPLVSLITTETHLADRLDYPELEIIAVDRDTPNARREAAQRARGEVLAFLAPRAVPAGNWLSGAVPFLARTEIAAVVCPTMAPDRGTRRQLAAAAVSESRLGGGSLYFRFTPGNLRFVDDFPTSNVVVRREEFLACEDEPQPGHGLCEALTRRGRRVVYTPETVIVSAPPPLFRPHLLRVAQYGRIRGALLRRLGPGVLRPSTLPPVGLVAASALGLPALLAGSPWREAWLVLLVAYALAVLFHALVAAFRFRSFSVAALAAGGSIATHFTYAFSLLRGIVTGAGVPRQIDAHTSR
jgi:glycosyltransferase involved in cell wall biosynthesis